MNNLCNELQQDYTLKMNWRLRKSEYNKRANSTGGWTTQPPEYLWELHNRHSKQKKQAQNPSSSKWN